MPPSHRPAHTSADAPAAPPQMTLLLATAFLALMGQVLLNPVIAPCRAPCACGGVSPAGGLLLPLAGIASLWPSSYATLASTALYGLSRTAPIVIAVCLLTATCALNSCARGCAQPPRRLGQPSPQSLDSHRPVALPTQRTIQAMIHVLFVLPPFFRSESSRH